MTSIHNSYRTAALLVRPFPVLFLSICTMLQAQSGVTGSPAKNDPPQVSVIAQKQAASADVMAVAVAKQKASAQAQVGSAVSSDPFFTSGWTTAPVYPIPAVVPACSPMPESDLTSIVAESAKTQDLKPELIRAVIKTESASYPCAISEKGAIGLMQLLPEVAQKFDADPLDPKQNVAAGSRYLKQLVTRYKGDLKLALAAYNAGPQRVDQDGKVPDIPETVAYVDAILKNLTQNGAHHAN